MLRTGVIHHFDITLAFVTPKSSCLPALMSPGGGGRCRAERTGARPSRAVMGRRRRRLDLAYTLVRLLERVETEGKKVYFVTTAGRCFLHHRAKK
jgi:hypothetical protein